MRLDGCPSCIEELGGVAQVAQEYHTVDFFLGWVNDAVFLELLVTHIKLPSFGMAYCNVESSLMASMASPLKTMVAQSILARTLSLEISEGSNPIKWGGPSLHDGYVRQPG